MASTAPPKSAAAAAAASSRPNHTLYCSNLPDKLQKDHLKRALYMLFSVYGPILDIVALKTSKMRGQAHVLFRDVSASTQAMRALQGFEFFGKEMRVAYATSKSDTLSKLDGTYKQPAAPDAPVAAQPNSLQQSIFSGAPGTDAAPGAIAPGTNAAPGSTAPLAPPPALDSVPAGSGQGVKRPRDESDDEKDEAPMDMDDEAMEESDGE